MGSEERMLVEHFVPLTERVKKAVDILHSFAVSLHDAAVKRDTEAKESECPTKS